MKGKMSRVGSMVAFFMVLVLTFSNLTLATPGAEQIYSDGTGFITTYGMLDMKVNQIGFAGTHNAFSNNKDRRSSFAWDTYTDGHNLGTQNQNISIKTMLDVGYRVIDLDIGDNGNGNTGCYHRYRLSGYSNLNGRNAILPNVKQFLNENPKEIVILHVSDVYNGTINPFKLRNHAIYHKGEAGHTKQMSNMLKDMRETGLLQMTYNFSGNNNTSYNALYSSIQAPGHQIQWPTIRQMIESGKRVLFLERDQNISTNIRFKDHNQDPNKTNENTLDINTNKIAELKGSAADKLCNLSMSEDWGASAGDINAARINNEGRRMYGILKKANSIMKDNNVPKLINMVSLDFVTGNTKQGGWLEVSPVDAVNRANYDAFGYTWDSSVGQWYWE